MLVIVTLAPGITAPLESFTTPRMVPVGSCAKTRQVGNAINATIAVTNVSNEHRLLASLLTISRSFRTANYESENKYGRRLGLHFRLFPAGLLLYIKTSRADSSLRKRTSARALWDLMTSSLNAGLRGLSRNP